MLECASLLLTVGAHQKEACNRKLILNNCMYVCVIWRGFICFL